VIFGLIDPQLIDIHLVLDDGSAFPAHKVVLACHSPFFRKMLVGGFCEAGTTRIELCEVSAQSVQAMLRFLYHGEVSVPSIEDALSLGRLADMYELPALRTAVLSAARAAAATGPSSAIAVLAATRAAGLVELDSECWEPLLEGFAAAAAAAAAAEAGGEWLLAMPECLLAELLAMARCTHARGAVARAAPESIGPGSLFPQRRVKRDAGLPRDPGHGGVQHVPLVRTRGTR
jgi:hypothetical protein